MTNKEATKLTLPTTLHQAQNGQREEEKRGEGRVERSLSKLKAMSDLDRKTDLDWQLDRPAWTELN